MKSRFTKKFRNQIALLTLISSAVTFLFESIFIMVSRQITMALRHGEYRSAYFNRSGFDPKMRMMVMIFLGLTVFIICFWLGLRKTMSYLDEISDGIQRIAEGDLDAPIPVKGENEFAKIAHNLNSMTGDIKELMEKERVAEQTKNDLITSVAHDLRTPLTSIIGYLDLIRNKSIPEDGTRERYLDIAYNKSKRLEKLTNELFGFAKLNHEKMDVQISKLDIVKLMGQLLDEFYPNFQSSGLECEFCCEEKSILVDADGNLLARLFDNLINNAIKYGADGKIIRVIMADHGEEVMVQVINFGRVIPEEDLENIFQKFYRVEQSRSANTGGTGLGLAIARSIVEKHGGMIEARSDLHGTVFEVRLKKQLEG